MKEKNLTTVLYIWLPIEPDVGSGDLKMYNFLFLAIRNVNQPSFFTFLKKNICQLMKIWQEKKH
jgi:hypothetical protein